MLTAETLQEILLDLHKKDGLGCTYDFKERYYVGLNSLAFLNLVTLIKTRIPKCGDHCERYQDCPSIELFENRKSKTKYRLTKEGANLADFLSSDSVTMDNLKSMLQKELVNYPFVDLVVSLLMDVSELSVEKLVASIQEQTNTSLFAIRTSIRDILDLLVSIEIIGIKEGIITQYA